MGIGPYEAFHIKSLPLGGKVPSAARRMRGRYPPTPAADAPLIRHLLRKCHLPPKGKAFWLGETYKWVDFPRRGSARGRLWAACNEPPSAGMGKGGF